MQNEDLVTIITVVKNARSTIEKTIQSVISQKKVNIEYIVIDAMSDDGTSEIINEYLENIDVYIREADDGLYYAMNKALNIANGRIIGILNSDDYYYNDEVISNISDRFMKSDADIIYGNAMYYDDKNATSLYPTNEYELWFRMGIPHPATFVRKRIYDKYGFFDTKYAICADYEFILRTYVNDVKMEHIDQIFTFFRRGGMNEKNEFLRYRELKSISLRYAPLLKNSSFLIKRLCQNSLKWVLVRKEFDTKRFFKGVFHEHNNVIWGVGKNGRRLLNYMLGNDIPIDFIVDGDCNKIGQTVCDYNVRSPEALCGYIGNVLIGTSNFSDEIYNCAIGLDIQGDIYTWDRIANKLTENLVQSIGHERNNKIII